LIQKRLLADGALAGLNEEARLVLYIVADTGMCPSPKGRFLWSALPWPL
jgi:hypothetical protein